MVEEEKEVSLYDIADWLWSYRVLAISIAVVVVATTVAMIFIKDSRAPQYEASFEVYVGGTPVRSVPEIVDILNAKMAEISVALDRGDNNALTFIDTKARADEVVAAVRQIETELLAEVDARLNDLQAFPRDNDGGTALILQSKSFLRGIESGLVTLIRSEVSEVAPAQSRMRFMMPAAFGAFVFILVVAIHSFWLGWRRHRKSST